MLGQRSFLYAFSAAEIFNKALFWASGFCAGGCAHKQLLEKHKANSSLFITVNLKLLDAKVNVFRIIKNA